jgi:hypothetical protein
MSSNKQRAAIVGVGAVACAACCAGSVLGSLAALVAGTVLGVALFGVPGLVVAVAGISWLIRRRRRQAACRPTRSEIALPLPTTQARR